MNIRVRGECQKTHSRCEGSRRNSVYFGWPPTFQGGDTGGKLKLQDKDCLRTALYNILQDKATYLYVSMNYCWNRRHSPAQINHSWNVTLQETNERNLLKTYPIPCDHFSWYWKVVFLFVLPVFLSILGFFSGTSSKAALPSGNGESLIWIRGKF